MKNDASGDAGLLSDPLSLLRNGYFNWNNAVPGVRSVGGLFWALRSAATSTSAGLRFDNTVLYSQSYFEHGYGFAVCRVVSLPILYVQKAGNYLLTQATNPSPLSLIPAIL